jgi:hypothetical protein
MEVTADSVPPTTAPLPLSHWMAPVHCHSNHAVALLMIAGAAITTKEPPRRTGGDRRKRTPSSAPEDATSIYHCCCCFVEEMNEEEGPRTIRPYRRQPRYRPSSVATVLPLHRSQWSDSPSGLLSTQLTTEPRRPLTPLQAPGRCTRLQQNAVTTNQRANGWRDNFRLTGP